MLDDDKLKYCNSLTEYSRFKTSVVNIGDLALGGDNPIRIQSMTTTDTMDTMATVEQSIRMIDAGCELVRITAPSIKEAQNLENIKNELIKRGYNTPLIADIHFTPNAAEVAAEIVEKVRVNPGNYADKKKFESKNYTDDSYQQELDRIEKKFAPLVEICKANNTAMRIGANHGSLSDRILGKYGDTPLGMVESAMEFVRICEKMNFDQLILSMKASNTQVMVQAYRLLVNTMIKEGMNYPLHLGVTEAGDGEDGRIKSAVGIGALLEDGLGDTIRVSLTEEPEYEVPVAISLANRYTNRKKQDTIPEIDNYPINPFEYIRRKTNAVLNIGEKNVPIVMADFALKKKIIPIDFKGLGYGYDEKLDKWHIGDMACDYIFVGDNTLDFDIPGTLGIVQNHKTWLQNKNKERHFPFLSTKEYVDGLELQPDLNIIYVTLPDLNSSFIEQIKRAANIVLLIDTYNENGTIEQRKIFVDLMNANCNTPVIVGRAYGNLKMEDLQLYAATDFGTLLIDGLGDGIFIAAKNCGTDEQINQTAFGILQATRTRISKTEYISCPSCGRTLFDLQETTAKIKAETAHLKGVKIGIMGCIVNGPGEMADADYGYVGTGVGKISLYRGQEVVKKGVDAKDALGELIGIIKADGNWQESY